MDFEDFRADPKTVAAVERMPLTISEAAKRLGSAAETLCPGQPWNKIRGTDHTDESRRPQTFGDLLALFL